MKVASLTSAVFSKLTNGLAANNTAYTASANLTFTVTFDDVFKQRDQVNIKGSPASANTLFTKRWEYFNSVDSAPGRSNYVSNRTSNTSIADELHIVVADEDGAILTKNPMALASALQKIDAGISNAPMRPTSDMETASSMMIAHPFRGSSMAKLFSTHPPTQERVKRLEWMAQQMGQSS